LQVEPKKQSDPTAEPLPKISRDLTSMSAYFGEPTKKGKNSADLPTSSLRDLDNWVRNIKKVDELDDVIADGRVPVSLEGHTSKSGSKNSISD